MTIRLPDSTRLAMLQAGLDAITKRVEQGQTLDTGDCVHLGIGAAIVELERRLNKGDSPPPVQAPPRPRPHDGGGNIHESGPTALGGPPKALAGAAKAQGYTGDACRDCGNFTVKRTGTCTTCTSCGSNTGCS